MKQSCLNCMHVDVCKIKPNSPINIPSFYTVARDSLYLKVLDGDITSKFKNEMKELWKDEIANINSHFYKNIGAMCTKFRGEKK